MTLLKDNNYKEINIALLSLEADIKKLGNNNNFNTDGFDAQIADINKRIDEINSVDGTVIKNLKNDVIAINSNIDNIENNIDNIEQQLSDIFSAKNKVTDFNTTTASGIYYWTTDAANKPGTNYGVLLVNKYSTWINQIAYGTNGKIYFRQKIDNENWTEWKAVAFDGEGKASFLDEYVGAGGTRLTSGNIVPKDSSEYGGMRKDVVTDSMTDSGRPGQDGHLLTMFWDNSGRYDSQFFVSNKNPPTVKARAKANGTDYGPWVDVITSDNIGSQTVSRASTAGTADRADRATGIDYTGESGDCISAQQTPGSFNNSDKSWASYIICNHGNGTTYYHQMLRLPFFSDTIQLQRRVNGELQGWKNVAIMENENTWSGRQNFTTAKASSKMVIPIGAPSQLEDGCIWIER